jgi:hypothetical protein
MFLFSPDAETSQSTAIEEGIFLLLNRDVWGGWHRNSLPVIQFRKNNRFFFRITAK